jgi:hypothetical protein
LARLTLRYLIISYGKIGLHGARFLFGYRNLAVRARVCRGWREGSFLPEGGSGKRVSSMGPAGRVCGSRGRRATQNERELSLTWKPASLIVFFRFYFALRKFSAELGDF